MQGGLTEGDALEGVITELAAMMIQRHNATVTTQHNPSVGGTAGACAVFTAGLNVVAVQFAAHGGSPSLRRFLQYSTFYSVFPVFFSQKHNIAKKHSKSSMKEEATDTETGRRGGAFRLPAEAETGKK